MRLISSMLAFLAQKLGILLQDGEFQKYGAGLGLSPGLHASHGLAKFISAKYFLMMCQALLIFELEQLGFTRGHMLLCNRLVGSSLQLRRHLGPQLFDLADHIAAAVAG